MIKTYPFSHFPPVIGNNYNQRSILKLKGGDNASLFQHDASFDWMYPEHLQFLSTRQWTPLSVAIKASEFLAEPGARVLDIGSGIGKFCLVAAYHNPDAFFHGVEQRQELVRFAEAARRYTHLDNANFINANITQINFKEFDHFYFYNSFYENLDPEGCIDNTIETSYSLYSYYTKYLYAALDEKPLGTRLVTFHSMEEEIPPGYYLADVSYDTLLKMWIKR